MMPQQATEYRATVNERGGTVLLADFVASDGLRPTQAQIDKVELWLTEVSDETAPVVKIALRTLIVADVIFDTLQTDAVLWGDDGGYNFLYELPAADLDQAGVFRCQIRVTPQAGNGEAFWLKWRLSALQTEQDPVP